MSDLVAVERSMRAALPARQEIAAGGWVIRISGGATKRINSANPILPAARLADVQGQAERLYAEHGLPPRFRLTPLADPSADRMLAEAGYAVIDRSFTMLAPAGNGAIDGAVHLACESAAVRLAGFGDASGWTAEQIAHHAELLARLPERRIFASLDDGAGPIAFGVASIVDSIAWLFDIAVTPAARGQGAGKRLTGALLGWAARQGCAQVGLQVLADNAPARALYRSLGFVDAYAYHYRIRHG